MKTWNRALLVSVAVLAITLPAQAAPDRADFRDRLEHQQTRIERGIDSGDLTKREAGELREEHRAIRRLAEHLRADGYSWRERSRILDRKLDRTERHIRQLMQNDEVRHDRGPGREPPRPRERAYDAH